MPGKPLGFGLPRSIDIGLDVGYNIVRYLTSVISLSILSLSIFSVNALKLLKAHPNILAKGLRLDGLGEASVARAPCPLRISV
jgi:hypothetical protein